MSGWNLVWAGVASSAIVHRRSRAVRRLDDSLRRRGVCRDSSTWAYMVLL